MSFITRKISGASRGLFSKVLLVLWGALVAVGALNAQEPIAPLVVDADGKPICGAWPETLLETGEQVKITLFDRYGQKLKVVVNGDAWRLIIMAGAEDSRLGCQIMAGVGMIAR